MSLVSKYSSTSKNPLQHYRTRCRCFASLGQNEELKKAVYERRPGSKFAALARRRMESLEGPWYKTRGRLIPKPPELITKIKPYYITTPIFYPNATPHIGHLYSLVVADIYARNIRCEDPLRPVHFITGTDEHGMKIQKAAEGRGMKPLELCDLLSDSFSRLAREAKISHTKFLRTSSDEHRIAVANLWRALQTSGYVYKGKHAGWYSVSDETFFTDSQVESRIDPKTGTQVKVSIETGNVVEWTEEENYKFRLSALREQLLNHFQANPEAIYPPSQREIVMNILQSDAPNVLPDLSISRPSSRLSWGIPVPNDRSQTIYVWLDALTSYLSGIGYPWKNKAIISQQGWPADLQIIGKDILKFHAIYFPAFLLAAGLPLPRGLLSHAHWIRDGRKMSKSLGNVVDPIDAIRTQGIDVVRWYLARAGGRFKDDVNWNGHDLSKHTMELRNLFGNLLLRMQSPKILSRLPAAFHEVPLHRQILMTRGNAPSPLVSPASREYRDVREDRTFGRAFGNSRMLKVAYAAELAVEAKNDPENTAPQHTDVLLSALSNIRAHIESKRRFQVRFYSELPETPEDEAPIVSPKLRDDLDKLRRTVRYRLSRREVSEATQAIVDVLVQLNKEFTRIAPWSETTSSRDVIHLLTWSRETLRICGILLQPFIPGAASALLDALRVDRTARSYAFARVGAGRVRSGRLLNRIIFPKEKQRIEESIRADHQWEENVAKKELAGVIRHPRSRYKKVWYAPQKKKPLNDLYAPLRPELRGPLFSGLLTEAEKSLKRRDKVYKGALRLYRSKMQRRREAIR